MEACVPIEAVGDSGRGLLVMASDLQPLRERLTSMAHRTVELSSAVAIGFIAGGFFLMRRLVRPINRLAGAALDLAYRHEYHQLPARGSDELGRLTQAFNHMAERLLRTQKEPAVAQRRVGAAGGAADDGGWRHGTSSCGGSPARTRSRGCTTGGRSTSSWAARSPRRYATARKWRA